MLPEKVRQNACRPLPFLCFLVLLPPMLSHAQFMTVTTESRWQVALVGLGRRQMRLPVWAERTSAEEATQRASLGTGAGVASSPVKPSFRGCWAFLVMLWCSERDSAPSPHTARGGQPWGKSFFQMQHLSWAVPATTSSFPLVFLCRWLVRTDVQHFCGMARWLPKSRRQRGKKNISLVVNPWPHCETHQTLRKQLKLFALVENGKDKSTGNCLLFCSQCHSYDYSLFGWDSFRRNGFQLKDKETGFCLVCLFWKILFLLLVSHKENLGGCKKHPPGKWEL